MHKIHYSSTSWISHRVDCVPICATQSEDLMLVIGMQTLMLGEHSIAKCTLQNQYFPQNLNKCSDFTFSLTPGASVADGIGNFA